ncbi:MAG: hypothetical protein ABEJ60_00880 [Halodesulfurarchaeum sp.]
MTETIYLTIPKEKAASILSQKKGSYFIGDDSGGTIEVLHDDMFSDHVVAELTDHKIPSERVETDAAAAESGILGTRVDYKSDTVKRYLEEYEVY